MNDRTCAVSDCDRPHWGHGLCRRHLARRNAAIKAAGDVPPPSPPPSEPGERWLPVVGFEGHYAVSDLGRIYSIPRRVPRRNGGTYPLRGGLLTPRIGGPDGRPTVSLTRRESFLVYRLVLEAFIGPCPPGMEACHGPDHDPRNCRLRNLRWDTHSSNMLDRSENGTDVYRNRERCPRAHCLALPNLVACNWAKGYRDCLACARANANGQTAKRLGWEFDFVTKANEHYAKIMHDIPSELW